MLYFRVQLETISSNLRFCVSSGDEGEMDVDGDKMVDAPTPEEDEFLKSLNLDEYDEEDGK